MVLLIIVIWPKTEILVEIKGVDNVGMYMQNNTTGHGQAFSSQNWKEMTGNRIGGCDLQSGKHDNLLLVPPYSYTYNL